MIGSIFLPVLRQRVFVMIAAGLLAGFGIYAFRQLPIEAFPDVQDVQVQVITQINGQAPEEMERVVTLPIELEMSGVPNLTQVRSVSITGLSIVTLTFADGTPDYFARQQVLEKLQTVSLPPGVQPSLAPLTTAVGEIYRYVLEAPPNAPISEVRTLQDWVVRPALRMVPSVADVVIFGGAIKEYQIQVSPDLLRKFQVTLDQVTAAAQKNGDNAGAGIIRRGDEGLVLRSIGIFKDTDDIADVVVASRGGRPVRVRDVAEVKIGEHVRSGIVGYDKDDDVVEGIVSMIKGANASKVVEAVKERVEQLNKRLPAGYRIRSIYERSELVSHTVATVGENLAVGALLVVGILVLFLRSWRAALIVGSVIPLALLFVFVLMHAIGVPANLLSLGAVDFGVIIDSSVVLVEALMVKLAVQSDPRAALKSTIEELAEPIIFSKGIIITAFLPIFTFQRVEGKIFTPVALTLSFALLGGLILALTWVPAMLTVAVKGGHMKERESRWMPRLQDGYRRLLARAEASYRLVIGASLAALAIAIAAAPLLGSEFLPKLDEGNIWLTITLPQSTALETTKDIEREVRKILLGYPEVKSVITQVGRPDDGTDPKGPNNLEILADLKPKGEWRFGDKEALVADMERKLKVIPGLPTNFSQVIEDNVEETLSGTKGEIAVKVFGPNLEVLESKAQSIARVLSHIRGAVDVAAIPVGGQTEVNVTLKRDRLARYGINVADINSAIQAAFGGANVNAIFEGDRRFDVTVRFALPYRDAIDDIAVMEVAIPAGGTVPLGELASIEVRQGAARVTREAGGRNATVKANLRGRDQGSFVAEAQAKVAALVQLPQGYSITWGGQFENQQRANARLKVIIPIALTCIFSLLFWTFRSLRPAFLVLAMIPFTLIGGFAGLALEGLHLSVSAAVGFIAVAGISVQNGVIMLERMFENLRSGMDYADAVHEGAVTRLRPIVMTALMAGLGLLPAALSHGIGSETQRPFAAVIVGGIVSATVFTLLLLPVLALRMGIVRRDPEAPDGS
jgi:heavy metal efflux system protein